MRLEFLDDISDNGKYKDVVSENLIRLYDFEQEQTQELIKIIKHSMLELQKEISLSALKMIEPVNCNVLFKISEVNEGILRTANDAIFHCKLTHSGYENMIDIMNHVDQGYNWLCDTSEDGIDFLYSPGGTW